MQTERQDSLMELIGQALAPFYMRLDKLETDMLSCFSNLSEAFSDMLVKQEHILDEQKSYQERINLLEKKINQIQKQLSTNSWDLRDISDTQQKLDGNVETLALRSLNYETELRKLKRITFELS